MSDTLQKVIEAGETDVEDELTTTETEAELEIETEADPEAVVAEEEGEVEVVLGDQGAPEPEQSGPSKGTRKALEKLREQRRNLRQETETLSSENTQLRAELDQIKKDLYKKPKYTDYATDEEYERAFASYLRATGGAPTTPQPAPQQPQRTPSDFSTSLDAHYDRAEKLGVNLEKFGAAERNVRAQIGDQLTDALIDSVGEGSEKVMMILGSNQAEFDKVKALLSSDATGLKAVGRLNRLAERAKVTGKRVSSAPKPARSPSGGTSGASLTSLQRKLAKAEKDGNANAMFAARRALRKAERAAASQK